MSFLNKLSGLTQRKSAQIVAVHPIANADVGTRLRYLSGISLAIAIDRQLVESEKLGYFALANSMGIDRADAEEQINSRNSVSEDDIENIFQSISNAGMKFIFCIDMALLHAADKNIDETEASAAKQLGDLLEVNTDALKTISNFAKSFSSGDRAVLQKTLLNLHINDKQASEYIKSVVGNFFPYSGVISGRYIDHGNGTLTDTKTDLMWARYCVGQSWINNTATGTASVFSDIDEGDAQRAKFNQLGPAGFTDWAVPTEPQLESLTVPKSSYPVIDEEAFPNMPAYWFFSSTFQQQWNGRMHRMCGYQSGLNSDKFVLRFCRNP